MPVKFPGMKRKKPNAALCRRIVNVYDNMEISMKLLSGRFELPQELIADILRGRVYKTIRSAKVQADGRLSPHVVVKVKRGKK